MDERSELEGEGKALLESLEPSRPQVMVQYTHTDSRPDGSVCESTHLSPTGSPETRTVLESVDLAAGLGDENVGWSYKERECLGPLHNTKGEAIALTRPDGSVERRYFIYGGELPYDVWLLVASAYDALVVGGVHPSWEERQRLIAAARDRSSDEAI